jgi:hypothetical protein
VFLFLDVQNLRKVNLRGIVKNNTKYQGILAKIIKTLKEKINELNREE